MLYETESVIYTFFAVRNCTFLIVVDLEKCIKDRICHSIVRLFAQF